MPTLFNSEKIEPVEGLVHGRTAKDFEHLPNPRKDTYSNTLRKLTEEEVRRMPGHTHNPLSPFIFCPDNVNFVNADNDEKVILLLRRHPITNLRWIFIAFIMIVSFPFVMLLTPLEFLPWNYVLIIGIIYYLFTFALIIEGFLSWFFHVNMITDERIMEVDFINLIYREITDANIEDIQDVTVEVGGGLRTIFGFGTVLVQTASEVPKIDFEDVPYPDRVAKILRELRLEEQVEKLEGRLR